MYRKAIAKRIGENLMMTEEESCQGNVEVFEDEHGQMSFAHGEIDFVIAANDVTKEVERITENLIKHPILDGDKRITLLLTNQQLFKGTARPFINGMKGLCSKLGYNLDIISEVFVGVDVAVFGEGTSLFCIPEFVKMGDEVPLHGFYPDSEIEKVVVEVAKNVRQYPKREKITKLPPKELIKTSFEEYLITYKPSVIISGSDVSTKFLEEYSEVKTIHRTQYDEFLMGEILNTLEVLKK